MPAAVIIGLTRFRTLHNFFFSSRFYLLTHLQRNCCAAPWRQTKVILSKHSETYRGESAEQARRIPSETSTRRSSSVDPGSRHAFTGLVVCCSSRLIFEPKADLDGNLEFLDFVSS